MCVDRRLSHETISCKWLVAISANLDLHSILSDWK